MSLLNIKPVLLPDISIQLGGYPSDTTKRHYQALVKSNQHATHKIGKNDRFQRRKMDFLQHIDTGGSLLNKIKNSADIRIVSHLWLENDAFVQCFPVAQNILDQFYGMRDKQGLLVMFDLVALFFKRFDGCGDVQALGVFLQRALNQRQYYDAGIQRLQSQAKVLFQGHSYKAIIAFSKQKNNSLAHVLEQVGISQQYHGRFTERCFSEYYIQSIKDLEVNEEADIFTELNDDTMMNSAYEGGRLGHQVFSVMIQKAIDAGVELSSSWRSFILNAAGDPRLTSSPDYHAWWALLSKQHIEAMQGWLAGLDLELFLKALENYANHSQDEALKRMYPARAVFLQGLYKHNLISLSKLFIGREPADYIQAMYDGESQPKFSKINDATLSVIYLKVGSIHMVEGSHAFKLRLYEEGLPNPKQFLSYTNTFSKDEVGPKLARQYFSVFDKNCFEVTHSKGISWQYKTIQEFAKYGVPIDPEWVLTPEDYQKYKVQYGLAVHMDEREDIEVSEPENTSYEAAAAVSVTDNSTSQGFFSRVIFDELSQRSNQRLQELAAAVQLGVDVVASVLEDNEKFEADELGRWKLK